MLRLGAVAGLMYLIVLPISARATEVRLIAAPMGAADLDFFGRSVSNAGDVNNDGWDDVIVGAPGNDIGGDAAGRAYVYFGGPMEVDTIADLVLTGEAIGDAFGGSVSGAGDVNRDGFADVIVGAYSNDTAGTDAGRAYVYYGAKSPDAVADLTFTGAAAGDNLGSSVSGAGDVNDDGAADIIVGALGQNGRSGKAYVYYGGLTPNTVADLVLTGSAANNFFGGSVSSAGDVNGDGHGDVIVGAWGFNTNTGRAYVYYGGPGTDEEADLVLNGSAPEDYFGYSVSGAGDVNGDGRDDVIVGAFGNDVGGSSAGRAYVYYSPHAIADLTLTGAAAIDQFGFSVSGLEDMNGDGYADVAVGAFVNDSVGADAGQAYVYYGGPGADAVADLTLSADATGDRFGISVSGAGDVDGDGAADLIVGAMYSDANGLDAGSAYLYVASGTLSSPIVAVGSSATVEAHLGFIGTVAFATLYFRGGGTASYSPISMTESPTVNGTWAATIPSGSVTDRGVEYYVRAVDFANNATVFPAGAPSMGTASLRVSVTNYPAFALPAGTYQLLGAPLSPTSTAPSSVFDELGGYNNSLWRYGTWDPVASAYKEHPNAAPTTPGQGFWVISRDAKSITMSGVSTDVGRDFPIVLGPGFNQIANPYSFPVDFVDMIRPASVEAQVYGWNGTAYVAGAGVLEPGKGYWIRNNGTGGEVIRIPPLGSGVSPGPSLAARNRSGGGAEGWSVRAAAYAGRFYDDQSRFGMVPGATDGKDASDFTHPPAPPEGYVRLSFLNDQGNRLLNDYRGESEGATWKVHVDSDQDGEPLRLRFIPEGKLPEGLELVAFEGRGAVEVDLLRDPEIRGEVVGGGSREWTVVAGTRSYVESVREGYAGQVTRFALGRAYPNPVRGVGGVTLDFEAPVRTAVTARVYDVQGRLVRTVVDGVVDRGVRRVQWDGRDQAGRTAAAGVYFLKLEASGFRAEQKILILR